MSHERSFGSLHDGAPGLIAAKLADAIMSYASARAVTLDPEGRVYLEPVGAAAECDLVGTYTRTLGVLELSRYIREDLLDARARLGTKPAKRVVLGAEATAKRRRAA